MILLCASVICEVINYYINNDSCIYMCMLDASKSFDRVTHLSLFNKLNLRNMCPTTKFLMCTYQRQSVMVNWNGECSFSVGNGVKQRGVLSPVLFTVCLDDLIDQLRKKVLVAILTVILLVALYMQMILLCLHHHVMH